MRGRGVEDEKSDMRCVLNIGSCLGLVRGAVKDDIGERRRRVIFVHISGVITENIILEGEKSERQC